MNGNLENRVENSLKDVTGILAGENLLTEFRKDMILEPIFQKMFGQNGEHIFISTVPNMNETITPLILLNFKRETIASQDTYFTGSIDMKIVLPTQINTDYNKLRNVGALIQRWMLTRMNLFRKVLGLIELGVEATFDYTGLAVFSGQSFPAIAVDIPFKFDMQKITNSMSDQYGMNIEEPLDSIYSDELLLEYGLIFKDSETNQVIHTTGDNIEQV